MMSEGTDWEPKRDQERGIVEDFLEKNMSGFTFESRNNGRETDRSLFLAEFEVTWTLDRMRLLLCEYFTC